MQVLTPVDFNPFADSKEIGKITFTNEPQREMWLACIIGGEDANLAYNESVSLEITGDLNFPAFKRAIDNLVLRHEALRATISPNGETLIIYKNFPVILDIVDLSRLNGSAKTELKANIRREINQALDIKEGPLFKVLMHKIGENQYVFTIIKHHIIGDGWSTGIMLEDLSKMYNAYIKGEEITLDKASQISDYASSQANFKLSKEYKETEDYWLNVYKDNVPVLDLPTDHPRTSPRSYKGNRIDHPLSNELANQIKAVGAKKAGASLVTTLLAAFEVFLYQQTKQKDVVVGLPSSGQAASGLTDVVGHCVNLLPLKSHIDPALSFTDYLKKRKGEVLDAYDHQRLTFGELIKKLYIPRDGSRIPLVPVIFNIDMGMDNAVAFDGLDFKLISNPREYEIFELYLNATRSKDGIMLEWSYSTALFDEATIETFNIAYHSILERIIADPTTSIAELTGVKVDIGNINTADEIYIPYDVTLNTLIAAKVRMYPDKAAVSFNNSSLTYTQLDKKADQLASFLISKGIETGDIVALSLDRSIEMLVSLLAVLKAGATYLPLDPSYPLDRIEFMLEDSGAKMLLVSEPYQSKYKTNASEIVIDEIWPGLGNYPLLGPKKEAEGDDLAYVIYTSGSTGKPKGVKITHRNLVNFLLSMQHTPGITAADRLLAITTISFDIAGLELYLPLISGAEVVIADSDTTRDGRLLLSILNEKKISIMQATPSTWQMMLDSEWEKPVDLKILSGGEPLSKELADKLLRLTSGVWNMYGPTETTIWSTLKQVMPGEKIITIGRAIDNTPIYLMDEQGKPVPNGKPGEIYIGGYGVAEGYLNRPELTAEKFVADNYSNMPGAMLYRTGDLGKLLANGEIQCLGRIDQQVKIRGHRIELGEIESALSTQKEVKQSVVIAHDDDLLNKYLVGYVITDSGSTEKISKELAREWKEKLAETLPAYMVPEEFIAMVNFPLTPNGKIDRKVFPKPDRSKKVKTAKILPGNDSEKLVADIFSQILGVSDLKVTDDFFELGGHSLLAVKVMVAIEKATGERLPLATLFNNSTIEKLALQLQSEKNGDEWDTIVPIKTSGSKPPLFLIHGSGLNLLMFKPISEHFDSEHPLYGVQAIGLTKPVEIPDTLEKVAAYHIDEMQKVDPVGPYAIAGYSYGGFIGYEIARQLLQSGKEVKFLGMIDSNASAYDKPASKTAKIAKKTIRQFHKVPFFVNSFIKYPKESLAYQQLLLKRKFTGQKMFDQNVIADEYTLYEQGIRANYNRIIDSYQIKPLDIEVSLFRVEKRLYFVDDQKYLGWDKLALKGVKILEVPGDHKTFLEPPNDERFAAIIQQAMDK